MTRVPLFRGRVKGVVSTNALSASATDEREQHGERIRARTLASDMQ
jgi:hypothetical protein